MQDKASCHAAKSVMAFLKQQQKNWNFVIARQFLAIPQLKTFGSSWNGRMEKKSSRQRKTWFKILFKSGTITLSCQHQLKKAILSMPRRIETVIANKDGYTKY